MQGSDCCSCQSTIMVSTALKNKHNNSRCSDCSLNHDTVYMRCHLIMLVNNLLNGFACLGY